MNGESRFAELDGGPLVSGSSLFLEIEPALRKNLHKEAIRCMHQAANHLSGLVLMGEGDDSRQPNGSNVPDCLSLTYSQLHRAALTIAAGMLNRGVQPGSTVLMLIPNGSEFGLLMWVCIVMRLTFAPLDVSGLDVSAIIQLVKALQPGVVVVSGEPVTTAMENALEALSDAQHLRISLEATANGWTSLFDLASGTAQSPVDEETLLENSRNDDPQRIHSVLFTSGTSAGQPKGCLQRVSSASHYLRSQSWLINPGNCTLVAIQAHNARAITPAIVLQTWRDGGTVLMPSTTPTTSFAIEHTVDAIMRHKVSFLVLSPGMVHALDRILPTYPDKPDWVRTIQLGGDTVTKDVLVKCAALFPSTKVCINHGMTEGGAFFKWPFFDTAPFQIPSFGEMCPIGTVAAGAKIRLWNPDAQKVVQRDEPGELHVCCGTLISHYLGEVMKSCFYEDEKGRWFITGDLAIMNEEGLVYIIGRSKDMIKRAGVAIMPVALEGCIEKYTGAQTCVVPIPHSALGQEPFAVVEEFNGRTEDEIRAHAYRVLGKAYALGGIFSLKELGLQKFPVNATHKIMKLELQQTVQQHFHASTNGEKATMRD